MTLVPLPKLLKSRRGRPVKVDAVSLEYGARGLRRVASLLDLCVSRGGLPLRLVGLDELLEEAPDLGILKRIDNSEAYGLLIGPKGVRLYARRYEGVVRGLATLAQLLSNGEVEPLAIADWPTFKVRGVVEGFYGKPWSWRARSYVAKLIVRLRMNAYLYAPKADPFHRERWRERYPEAVAAQLRRLGELCRSLAVDFIFAVSPGLDVTYSSDLDEKLLADKLLEAARWGVRSFAVLFDDIPLEIRSEERSRYRTLAEAQADFVNRVYERLRSELRRFKMLVCPTVYSGEEPDEYAAELYEELRPEITVMWTGPRICSREVYPCSLLELARRKRRKVLLWDNYPVNDYCRGRLNLGPLRGRRRELPNYLEGVLFNPMNEAYASSIPLATCSDYAWGPDMYDPQCSWESGLRMLCGDLAPEVELLAKHLGVSTLWPEHFKVPSDLKSYFWNILSAAERLSHLPRDLWRDIKPYAEKLKAYGRAGLDALEALSAESSQSSWARLSRALNLWDEALSVPVHVGDVAVHEEKPWRTVITRSFLDELLSSLVASALGKWKISAACAHISSTLTLKGARRRVRDLLYGYVVLGRDAWPGDSVRLLFTSAVTARSVRLVGGGGAILAVNGREASRETTLLKLREVEARFVKRATALTRLGLRLELLTSVKAAGQCRGARRAVDGVVNTYAVVGGPARLVVRTESEVNELTVLQDYDRWALISVDAYANGTWRRVGVVKAPIARIKIAPTASRLRLRIAGRARIRAILLS